MKKLYSLIFLCLSLICFLHTSEAAKREILFVPHDNRPVSLQQTADTIRKLENFSVQTPPEEYLGSDKRKGDPDQLWNWLDENARGVDAAVVSADALLYGSLVNSRKHDLEESVILERAERFKKFRQDHPQLRLYVFASVMRTPRQGGGEEPEYYAKYGADIFHLTALEDKQETEKLTRRERRLLRDLTKAIPPEALKDWMKRRECNFTANRYLVELAKEGQFNYLILGRDDNAPHSQTHRESRYLKEAGAGLSAAQFQVLAGIDEMGMLLLTRAVNDLSWNVPLVHVVYADGSGKDTVPSYSDERIEESIRQHLTAAGGICFPRDKNADLVLMVSTRYDGTTPEANWPENSPPLANNTAALVDAMESFLSDGKKIAVADIAFGNGADNALMERLRDNALLPRLNAYAGWNTATNSTGFALGQGILSLVMTEEAKNDLLKVRYLDDWAYQANVRQEAAQLLNGRTDGSYMHLDKAKRTVSRYARRAMNQFAAENLRSMDVEKVTLDFPWNRMFEADVAVVEE